MVTRRRARISLWQKVAESGKKLEKVDTLDFLAGR